MAASRPTARHIGGDAPIQEYLLSPSEGRYLLDVLSTLKDRSRVSALYRFLQLTNENAATSTTEDSNAPGTVRLRARANRPTPSSSALKQISDARSRTEYVEDDDTQLVATGGPARTPRTSANARHKPYQRHASSPECVKGGVKYHSLSKTKQKPWSRSEPARRAKSQAFGILAALASPSPDAARRWASEIRASSVGTAHLSSAAKIGTLAAAVSCCSGATGKGVASEFNLMLAYIQLVLKCHRMLSQNKFATLTSLHEGLEMADRPSIRTFFDWHARGSKYAAVAAGGSLYALILVAGTGLRVRLGEIDGRASRILGNTLRAPQESELEDRLVSRHIVPLVAFLREGLPLKLENIFPEAQLEGLYLDSGADGANLGESDQFFSGIQFNDVSLIARDPIIWAPCYSAPHVEPPARNSDLPQRPPVLQPSTLLPENSLSADFETVRTAFQPFSADNLDARMPDDRSANYAWTERERRRTDNCLEVVDVDDLREQLQEYYSDGVRADFEQYLQIPPSAIDAAKGQALRVEGCDGSLMVFVSTAMPSGLRERLTDCLIASFGGRQSLIPTNSADAGEDFHFQTLLFSSCNRDPAQGTGAPTDISPSTQVNSATLTVGHAQFTSYAAKERIEYEELYRTTTLVFSDVFEWVASTLATCLPEEFELLKIEAEAVPGNHSNASAVYPFTGFVVNLNVATRAHREAGNPILSVLLPLGEFEDGALVLLEPGLVLPLRSGDLAAFPSCRITHFNRHFTGLRASIMLHTDDALEVWTRDGNRNELEGE